MHTPEALPRLNEAPLRVCHVASGDRWAGAEAQIAMLVRTLRHQDSVDVCAVLLNEGRLADEIRDCGAAVMLLPEADNDFVSLTRHLRSWLLERPPHILHSHGYKANMLAALAARGQNSIKLVRTQHGLPEPFRGIKSYRHSLLQRMDAMGAKYFSDQVITVSKELATRLEKHLRKKKIVTIHNAIDISRIVCNLSVSQGRQLLGLDGGRPVIGTAARLEPIKRLDLFLQTAKAILCRMPDTNFVIAGDGSDLARLRSMATKLCVAGRVHFIGHRQEIFDVLRAFDIFLLTSDHEGFPTAPLEAMSMGVPVVARNVGGLPEMLQNGVNGVLVDSSDTGALAQACLQLLEDRKHRTELGLAASQAAQCFDIAHAAAEVLALYRVLVRNTATSTTS